MASFPSGYDSARGALDRISARTWHDIARLRQDVFIVEQECAYPDLDGRDGEAGCEHLWVTDERDRVVATLRILVEEDGSARRIGRVATESRERGRGIMAALLGEAIEACAGVPIHLDAQSHLEGYYARLGFIRAGEEFLEDEIPHVPMLRDPR